MSVTGVEVMKASFIHVRVEIETTADAYRFNGGWQTLYTPTFDSIDGVSAYDRCLARVPSIADELARVYPVHAVRIAIVNDDAPQFLYCGCRNRFSLAWGIESLCEAA